MATKHELEIVQAQNMNSIRGMSYQAARDLGYTPTPAEAESAIAGANRLAEAIQNSGGMSTAEKAHMDEAGRKIEHPREKYWPNQEERDIGKTALADARVKLGR